MSYIIIFCTLVPVTNDYWG